MIFWPFHRFSSISPFLKTTKWALYQWNAIYTDLHSILKHFEFQIEWGIGLEGENARTDTILKNLSSLKRIRIKSVFYLKLYFFLKLYESAHVGINLCIWQCCVYAIIKQYFYQCSISINLFQQNMNLGNYLDVCTLFRLRNMSRENYCFIFWQPWHCEIWRIQPRKLLHSLCNSSDYTLLVNKTEFQLDFSRHAHSMLLLGQPSYWQIIVQAAKER